MQDFKLVKMFKTLNPEECKYLRWFVQSDFFNTDLNLLRLFEALAKHYPAFPAKAMTKEGLFGKVFVAQPFSDAKWRNLISKMTKVMEDYLVWLELEQQETTRQKLLTAAYGRRNLFEQFEKSTNALSEKLEKQSQQSADALRERMLLNLQFYHHPQTAKVNNLSRLQSAMDDLDYYYFAEKLRLACDLKVFENMVTGAVPIRLKDEITNLAQQPGGRQFAFLETYARVFSLLERNPTMDGFQQVFDYFSGIAGQLSEGDRQFGLLHLLNYAINQSNKGSAEYYPKALKLYKLGLEQKVLIRKGSISNSTFSNIVTTGSRLKEFAWTKHFIVEHEKNLPPDSRMETRTLSLGRLHFHQNEFSQVIDLLLNHPFQDFNNILSSKNLLLRCYFEMFLTDDTYYPLFISFSKAFDKFVKREKQLSLTRKQWYKNLIFSLLKIARHKSGHDWNQDVKLRIKHEILSKPMYLKTWVLERIEDW